MAKEHEWWHETWNPVTGCDRVSPGCDHCWAHTNWNRFHKGEPFTPTFYPERLNIPLRWKKPRIIMACSMGDLFHRQVKWQWVEDIEEIIRRCSQHRVVILTKRPKTAVDYYSSTARPHRLPDNLWLGTSAENQECFDERYAHLIQVPAALRVLSLEPLLGPIDLPVGFEKHIGWVQVGCETGPGARPCNLAWIEDIVEQCQSANVPCFIKKIPIKGKPCGDMSQWPEYLRVREVPK